MYHSFSFFFISLFTFPVLFAQSFSPEVISSAGDVSEGTNVTLCWTLGEAVTETVESSSLKIILTQGFWQPENHVTTAIETQVDLSQMIQLNVFPNPTSSHIFLRSQSDQSIPLEMILLDVQGRQLTHQKATLGHASSTNIDISSYSPGTYYLLVLASSLQARSSFKIVKR